MDHRRIETWGDGYRPAAAYSAAVMAAGLWFVSGQLPLDHASGTLVEGDATAQAHAAIDGTEGILREAGLGLGDVAMLTVLLADIADWGALDAVVAERFPPDRLPARIVYQAARCRLVPWSRSRRSRLQRRRACRPF